LRRGLKDANVLEVAVSFSVVESITDYEFVRDGKADVIALDRFQAARRFVEQRGEAERFRTSLAKNP
jgi:hypothetical protein